MHTNATVILLGIFALIGGAMFSIVGMAMKLEPGSDEYTYGQYGLVAFGIGCIAAGLLWDHKFKKRRK